jgi:hypothetical protein
VDGSATGVEEQRLGLADHVGHGHDRAVEVVDAVFGGPGRGFPRLVGRGRGEVDDGLSAEPLPHRVEAVADTGVVEEHGHDDVGGVGRFVDRSRGGGAERGKRLGLGRGAVPDRDVMSCGEEGFGDRGSHGAESEDADALVRHCCDGFLFRDGSGGAGQAARPLMIS